MKKKIQKLIKEYQGRIANCDILIKDNKESMIKNRHGRNKDWVHAELQKEKAVNDARRQSYVQFIADLESLEP